MLILVLLVVAVLSIAAIVVLSVHASPAVPLALGIALTVFAGSWTYMHVPVGPDRLLFLLGLFLLVFGVDRHRRTQRVRFRTEHALMLALSVYAALNALFAHTLLTSRGAFALFDRLSITGFILFAIAPVVFHDRRTRNVLLVTVVVLGAYLGFTALMEGIGLKALVLPHYINDPTVGIHYGRARGPMLEAAAFGLALFECAAGAAVAARQWRPRWARNVAWLVAVLCLAGTVLTLTRSVWVGVVAGLLVVAVIDPWWRRRLIPLFAVAAVALVAVLSFSSSLNSEVQTRSNDQGSIWDRLNIANAAVNAVEAHPLFGVGWRQFRTEGERYMRLLPNIPETGVGLDAHNAVLSYAAELGIVGATLWVLVVLLTIGRAMVARPPPGLRDWHLAMVAMGVQWVIVAMLTPFSYTFSFVFVWAWAGILCGPRITRTVAVPEEARVDAVA